ncbi:MAG: PH domain-containing protein [Gammaproteobacteria bacterium]|nr:PH domain-containing protein [Gammaproteobacteria bacterium]MBU1558882.1 PH domain-containing protein [Gammaproteobacteria bacterium]MBU1628746.1 PH domain-containing protein [Gammaproteobacteria bacterium]MBU1926973.1 PH domain-containing protein [Gammaproteobacteria bacterium]MBU2545588.1 PH domain-containing protein [Gammaproteobacteria bacterium]
MTSYIDNNLLPDEKVIHRGHRHWIVFGWPIAWVFISLIFVLRLGLMEKVFLLPLFIALVTGFDAFIDYTQSELAVTNRRIMLKMGWLSRSSMEIALENIASINVEQSLGGRFLGYGTLTFNDVGSARSPYKNISDPFAFRKAALDQLTNVGK